MHWYVNPKRAVVVVSARGHPDDLPKSLFAIEKVFSEAWEIQL